MRSLNRVELIGNLGQEPEMRYTPNGKAVTQFNLATNMAFKDDAGKDQERTEWHRIIAWEKTGELCNEHLTKGSCVFVSGRLQTRSYEDKDHVKRWATEIVASQVIFLDKKDSNRRPEPPLPEDKVPATDSSTPPEPIPFVDSMVSELGKDGIPASVSP
jgi:single-strand DNA-binding protein